jgi:hypothetical protein
MALSALIALLALSALTGRDSVVDSQQKTENEKFSHTNHFSNRAISISNRNRFCRCKSPQLGVWNSEFSG